MKNGRWMAAGAVLVLILSATAVRVLMERNLASVLEYGSPLIFYEDALIKDVYTDKSRYFAGDHCKITVSLENPWDSDIKLEIRFVLKHLDRVVRQDRLRNVKVASGEKRDENISMQLPQEDFKGYLLEVWAADGRSILDFNSTAIDVSSDWTKFPRYGYIAGYPKQDCAQTAEVIAQLCKYHLNGLQFYDWQHKHHRPLLEDGAKVGESWTEISGRTVYADTIRSYISEAHKRNIAAMNYNLLYGAWVGYEEDGVKKEWGLFKDKNHTIQDFHPLPGSWASHKLLLFNPMDEEWQDYVINREKEVFRAFDFDGWHMDQLGARNYPVYDYEGRQVELTAGYASLIEKAAKEFPGKNLVFNAVGQYGQTQVARVEGLDFLYAEIWNGNSYRNLQSAIDEGNRLTEYKKATVLAAYMNYRKSSGEFNDHAVRLADAVIFASGGAHIELGDAGMLSSEYFPNAKLVMGESLKDAMRRYYDFLTAYQNFLRDACRPAARRVASEKIRIGSAILPGTVWYMAREKAGYEILHLINFSSNNTNNWRDDAGGMKPPEAKENFRLKYYTDSPIAGACLLSPDFAKSSVKRLDFITGTDETGTFIEIEVPRLEYWDMVVFQKNRADGDIS